MNLHHGKQHPSTDVETTALVVTRQELWLLQRYVRHELVQQEQWKFPPASLELNDQIAAGLTFCHRYSVDELTLQVSWGDLLVLDYLIPQDIKDVDGKPVGLTLLLKTFQARDALRRGYPYPTIEAPPESSKDTVRERLADKETDDAFQRRYPD